MVSVLQLNDRGDDVKRLQTLLNAKINANLVTDGNYGAVTFAAVVKYQKANGLTADGIAGPITLEKIGMITPAVAADHNRVLGKADYIKAANELKCPPEMVHGLGLKETKSQPFLKDGRTVILYERVWFYKLIADKALRDKLVVTDRAICYPTLKKKTNPDPIDRYVGGAGEYDFLNRARQYDENAALQSASYGQFQVMGFNALKMGYSSVNEFVQLMNVDVYQHLEALVRFIEATPAALKAIRIKDYAGLALAYNGPAYALNNYDKDLKKLVESVQNLYK
jgi:peptidoglycan hydrolase-like protein with peptidoglycan-binding domain